MHTSNFTKLHGTSFVQVPVDLFCFLLYHNCVISVFADRIGIIHVLMA